MSFFGEKLAVAAEECNKHDCHTVTVMKDATSFTLCIQLQQTNRITRCMRGGQKAQYAFATGAWRLIKAWRSLVLWPGFSAALIQGRRLFEGSFYSKKYSI